MLNFFTFNEHDSQSALEPTYTGYYNINNNRYMISNKEELKNHTSIMVNCIQKKSGKEKQLSVQQFYKQRRKCLHSMDHKVTFFHAGKAGGGTILSELRNNKIGFLSMSHPYPSPKKVEELQTGVSNTLIINIRDPVDRFVSAFKWRSIVLCSPNDTRVAGKGATHNPKNYCKTGENMKAEESLMREVYHSNPNEMAEALCIDSPRYEQAVQDYDKILHTAPLSEWLSFLIDEDRREEILEGGIRDVIALPLEKKEGADESLFEHHIQQLSLHLLHRVKGYKMSDAQYILRQKPDRIDNKHYEIAREKRRHSSVEFHNKSSANSSSFIIPSPSPLSELGECCLSRHLMTDYCIIQSMLRSTTQEDSTEKQLISAADPLNVHPSLYQACKWGSIKQQELCREDLESMLMRRSRYLDESLGSCSSITR